MGYIEREKAIEAFDDPSVERYYGDVDPDSVIRVINSIPAANVRPVVLCRDCVNYVESDEAKGDKMCVIDAEWCVEDGCYYGFTAYTPPDWFCAGGKKREES